MKSKQIIKIATDILMTAVLLLLMAYSLIGETAHEWLGISIFMLFVLHHILNRAWMRNIGKGKYTAFRIAQTILVGLVSISMLGSMVSGIVLSRYTFAFLSITSGSSWARTLHMLSAYWGFIFLSLHLGLHWNTMMGMAKRMFKKPSDIRKWSICIIGILIAAYGAYAFIQRGICTYMFLQNTFVFFDFEEPLIFFLLDYIAVMGLFVFIGHYLTKGLKCLDRKDPDQISE